MRVRGKFGGVVGAAFTDGTGAVIGVELVAVHVVECRKASLNVPVSSGFILLKLTFQENVD